MKRVLVVDDVPENIDLLKNILSEDYNVQVAKSGKVALDVLEISLPDIILLDIMMPEMNGFEVCKRLKSCPKTRDIPVIFLTAVTDSDSEKCGFDVGGVDFITKPISPLTTRSRVASHLKIANINLQNKETIKLKTQELDNALRAAIEMLGEVGRLKDNDTGIHIWRMADYSAALAKKIGWDGRNVELIKLAAPMHDMGKVGIPDTILKSPNKLTEEEWLVMREHTKIGGEVLGKSDAPLFQLAAEIALGHHEKWDGSGYPSGLSGEEIPLSARIVALADVFDALTMERSYKKSWSVEAAFEYIQQDANKHFDPHLVECFLSIEEELRDIKDKWSKVS